ncbi:hypothetical protein [Polaribacter sp.]
MKFLIKHGRNAKISSIFRKVILKQTGGKIKTLTIGDMQKNNHGF